MARYRVTVWMFEAGNHSGNEDARAVLGGDDMTELLAAAALLVDARKATGGHAGSGVEEYVKGIGYVCSD